MHSTKWLDGSGWISPHMGGWEPSYWLPLPYPPSVHASDYAANISAQLAATRAQHGDAFAEAVSTALDDNKQQGLGGKQPPPLRFSIGNLVLQKGREGGKIWIETERGEGGDFPIADIEALIREYYDANF